MSDRNPKWSPEPWTYSEPTGYIRDAKGRRLFELVDSSDDVPYAEEHANGYRVVSLGAENERLRTALTEIQSRAGCYTEKPDKVLDAIAGIARDALTRKVSP